jgi:phosphohistidine phosphatase
VPVYLVQHGQAVPEGQDPARPLNEGGREEVERVARHVATLGVGVAEIWHSGKLRARQTAEIFRGYLRPEPVLREQRGMNPGDDPVLVLPGLEAAADPVLLVGHLPHLSRLASLLLVGDSGRGIIQFRNAGVVCLARGEGGWRLDWALPPDLLPGVASR